MSWIAEYDTQGREFPTCVHVTKTTGTMTRGATYVPIEDGKAVRVENKKLRELVRDLYCLAYPSTVEWEVSDETYDKYSPCEKCNELHGGKSPCASTSKDMTEECCAPIQASVVADRMRELGVDA